MIYSESKQLFFNKIRPKSIPTDSPPKIERSENPSPGPVHPKMINTVPSTQRSNLSNFNNPPNTLPNDNKDALPDADEFSDPNQFSNFNKEQPKQSQPDEPKTSWGVGTVLDSIGKFVANVVENKKGELIPNILVLSDGKEVPNIILDKDGKILFLKY